MNPRATAGTVGTAGTAGTVDAFGALLRACTESGRGPQVRLTSSAGSFAARVDDLVEGLGVVIEVDGRCHSCRIVRAVTPGAGGKSASHEAGVDGLASTQS